MRQDVERMSGRKKDISERCDKASDVDEGSLWDFMKFYGGQSLCIKIRWVIEWRYSDAERPLQNILFIKFANLDDFLIKNSWDLDSLKFSNSTK